MRGWLTAETAPATRAQILHNSVFAITTIPNITSNILGYIHRPFSSFHIKVHCSWPPHAPLHRDRATASRKLLIFLLLVPIDLKAQHMEQLHGIKTPDWLSFVQQNSS